MVEKLLRAAFVLLVLLGGLVLPISAAQACSCAMGTPMGQLNRADAVFTGDVVDQRGDFQRVVYTIEVDQVYKGQVGASQEVVTSGNGASCGIALPRRYPVLIFAASQPFGSHLDDGQLATSLCSGSGPGTSVPVGFGPGEPPMGAEVVDGVSVLDYSPSDGSGPGIPVIVGAALGIVVLLLGVVTFMRRRGVRSPSAP